MPLITVSYSVVSLWQERISRMHGVGSASTKETGLWSVFPGVQCSRVLKMFVVSSRVVSPCGLEEGT